MVLWGCRSANGRINGGEEREMKVSVAKCPRHVKQKRRGNSAHMPRHKNGEGW